MVCREILHRVNVLMKQTSHLIMRTDNKTMIYNGSTWELVDDDKLFEYVTSLMLLDERFMEEVVELMNKKMIERR